MTTEWEQTRLKYVADCNVRTLPESTSADQEFAYVDVSNVTQGQMTIPAELVRFGDAPSRARRLAEPGDSIVSTVRTYLRAVATVPESAADLVFSTAFAVLSPNASVDGRFLAWYLQGDEFVSRVESRSVGVSYPAITSTQLMTLDLRLPPLRVQRAIADYLDRETAQIDTLIEEQHRLVSLVRERRQVARADLALGGDSRNRDAASGLSWAGNLPVHWLVVPLTSVATLESGHTPSRTRPELWEDCNIPWVSLHDVGQLKDSEFIESTAVHISEAGIANSSARLLPKGTVVLSRDATVGRSGVMSEAMATSQHFAAWVCDEQLLPRYLRLLLDAPMQNFFKSFGNGSTLRTIGMRDIKSFRIPLPPLCEQLDIVERADEMTRASNELTSAAEALIRLALERRAALITAAVTGQIDVGAAV